MAQAETVLPSDFFLDLDRSSPVPLYYQIATRLERAIRDEDLPAGSRLENEISLGQRFGFSRPTVRRAIQELVDKGLLVRRRGIGTQVVHGQVTRNVELTSLYEDLTQTGQGPTTEVVSREVLTADENAARELGVAVGDRVLRIVRLRYADGVPLAVLDNTLPSEFADFTEEELAERGLYQLLRARGITIRVAKQRIGARNATAKERELLALPKGSAVLTMSRTAFDSSGRAVEFGQHCYSPDLYSFEMTLVDK
ncbi:GntR family transcriptional regulator [Agromyces kandeliae]|uniref:UTRA domain-containing protein n=1 Tax=Agromyces kandeliae TaxID=2666141 RepID=A0A6L5R5P1_9MICO|nr:GntR family transcriptional regulator [Agromyces kandeliae]MRX45190.1 UTRA domain-containing protein [Agromyces kandeliae]